MKYNTKHILALCIYNEVRREGDFRVSAPRYMLYEK